MRKSLLSDWRPGAVAALGLALWPAAGAVASGGGAAEAVSVFVTFEGRESGIAEARVEWGRIERVRRIGPETLSKPFKIAARLKPDGGVVVFAAAGGKETPALEVVSLPENNSRTVALGGEISDLALAGENAVVAASKGLFYKVSPEGAILGEFNTRKLLNPPGRKGEHIRVLPGGERALVSFQKDDDNTAAKGERLVLVDLEAFKPLADMPLPRDKPELHAADDPTAQGPGPEVIVAFPQSGTVAVTLDLYGAVLFAGLRDILDGRLGAAEVVSSAANGAFGSAFPDRALGFSRAGRDWLLVSNAAPGGGFALFDAAARRAVRHFPAPAGAEPPVICGSRLVTVISGKMKTRSAGGVKKTSAPAKELHVFDLPEESGGAEGLADGIVHRVLPLPFDPVNILPVSGSAALVTGSGEDGPVCALIDPADGQVLSAAPLPGPPARAAVAEP